MTRSGRGSRGDGVWRLIALAAAVVLLTVLWPALGIGPRLAALRDSIASLGALAPVAYVAFYAVAIVLAVPAAALTVSAGGLFGPWLGVLVAALGANLGSALAFLIARYVARDAVSERILRHERVRRIDTLVAEHGAPAVAFVRLVPVFPFTLTCYAFGLTGVPFSTYVLWTAVASFPGTVLYVVGSATVVQALATRRFPLGLAATFLVTLAVVVVLARLVGRRLDGGRS